MSNWIKHVKSTLKTLKRKNPQATYKDALMAAPASYKKDSRSHHKVHNKAHHKHTRRVSRKHKKSNKSHKH